MSAHLPQPAHYPGYSDAAAYLGVTLQGTYEPQTQHVVNASHFPLVQTSVCSPYQHHFVAQQLPVAARSSVSSVSSLPASSPLADFDNDELKHDKEAIHAHPLFPLLELLFEKCELATTTSWEQEEGSSVDYPSRRVNDDIAAFAKKIRSSFPYYTPQPDVDALMVQAIQTLRFHLMELEKVHELCHSFCERYVSCLKGKMPMDLAVNSERDFSTLASESAAVMTEPVLPLTGMAGEDSRSPDFLTDHQMFGSVGAVTPTTPSDTGLQEGALESVGFSVDSPRFGIPPNGTASGIMTMTVGHGQPLALQTAGALDAADSDVGSAGGEEVIPKEKTKTRKRGIFPKSATNIMKGWLFQHLAHPYPSEEQKRQLSQETGLTILQVNNWFINARRRIVQPMIDASNRAGKPSVAPSFRIHGRKTPDPGSPSGLPPTGMAPFQTRQPVPTSHTIPMAGGEPFMAHRMMPQGGDQPQAVMSMHPPPLRQGPNAPLPLTHLPPPLHLPPQGMPPNTPQGMMPGYPGMMPAQSMPLQPMFVPCPPHQQMMPHQHMMSAPGLTMMPPSPTIPAHTMVSPSGTVISPPCSFVSPPPIAQPAPPVNVVPQGYMVASTVPAPHLTYHPQHAPVMMEHPQQQQ